MSWRARFSPGCGLITTYINPKDPQCFGVRNWWRTNLPELQLLNPTCNFQIQELNFGEPKMIISYGEMDQRMVRLAGATEDEVEDIMCAISNYADSHVIQEGAASDDGGGPTSKQTLITNFGYAESFHAKMEVAPSNNVGQNELEGIDDPGQRARVLPKNDYKFTV